MATRKLTIAERLDAHIRKRKMSQGEVARRLGVSAVNVSRWRRGIIPRGDNYERLMELLMTSAFDRP